MNSSFVILIPAYNAERSIETVVRKCLRHADASRVVIVDDGSTDLTRQRASASGARVVTHSMNLGKGAALRTGFLHALQHYSFDWLLTLDADAQHDPDDIPRFIEAGERGGGDIVLGSRRRWGTTMPFSRKLSNTVTSFLVSMRTGHRIPDSQCGYRIIRRSVLRSVVPDSDGFEAETEFLLRAAKAGFTIGWIPIRTIYETHESHMTHWATTKKFVQTLLKEY